MTRKARIAERVDGDLKAGRIWKARDRLLGLLRADPANQWALNRLGEIYFRMGDLPQAGRFWFVTEREGPEWAAAEGALYEHHGRRPENVVAAIHVRAAIDRYPPKVQERLRMLQRRLQMEGRFWEPRDRPKATSVRTTLRDRLMGVVGGLMAALFVVALGVGLYNIVLWVIGLVRLGSAG